MKEKRIFKIVTFFLVTTAIIVLVKYNVTATKEDTNIGNSSVIKLEINSEVVQDVYSKLVYPEDDFIKDDTYRNFYFKIDGEKKIISYEEKLYTVFNSLYKKNMMSESSNNEEETITLSIDEESVKNEYLELFIDESFEPKDTNYSSTLGCGVESQEYKDGIYEFTVKKCKSINEISKTELVSAEKDGNFINLKIKSFLAMREKDKKGKYTENYLIKNHNGDDVLDIVTFDEINDYTHKIFDEYDIDEYILSFKLKGDNYYLTSVQKG